MPKVIRNWWIETRTDGVKNPQATGPRTKDGGFDCRIYQREAGEVTEAAEILGRCVDGKLRLTIWVKDQPPITFDTIR